MGAYFLYFPFTLLAFFTIVHVLKQGEIQGTNSTSCRYSHTDGANDTAEWVLGNGSVLRGCVWNNLFLDGAPK